MQISVIPDGSCHPERVKLLFFLFLMFLSIPVHSERYPRTATGIEAGVARLSNGKGSALGTSWAWHFEYRPDKFVGFFGHAGQNAGDDKGKHIQQNFFAGGGEVNLVHVLDLRLGIAQSLSNGKNAVGPLVGLAVSERSGVWRPGVSAEVIRAGDAHSFALRGFVYFDL